MSRKKVSLVINPRDGQNIAKIPYILAVLAAVGWKTQLLMKWFGGQTIGLASRAAQQKADLVVAYGGDGTLNQVVNGVLKAKGKSRVGLLPGGTANEWAGELHIPQDPVKAALALINSKLRNVDLGHVEVEELIFPDEEQGQTSGTTSKKCGLSKKEKASSKAKHDFLMMAGLGFDATVIGHTSNDLKHRIGPLAFDLAAAKSLPKQHTFPVEIWGEGEDGRESLLWKGNALQIIIANTRTYANMVQIAADAYLDDGVIDICVIISGDTISAIGQLTSIVLQHKPDNLDTKYFRGAHFSIRVPANVNLQLDGSAVKLKDYIRKADEAAVQQAGEEQVTVNYRFEAHPKAIQMLVPRNYDDELFEKQHEDTPPADALHETESVFAQPANEKEAAKEPQPQSTEELAQAQQHLQVLLNHGRTVTVIGGAPDPAKKHCYILAGGMIQEPTGEIKPVAVRLDEHTVILNKAGEHIPLAAVEQLQEGEPVVVDGKKNKSGVIRATRILI